jgi:EmrB/QacA subfamily drug resistance transporter
MAADRNRTPSPWTVLAVTTIPLFAISLDTTILYVAFPSLRHTFASVSPSALSWVLNAYTIVFAALLVASGRFADRVGRKRAFVVGSALFTLASVACGAAPTVGLLIAARALQAAFAALVVPASLALVLSAFPVEKRPVAIGIWGAIAALAAAVGPALGSAIVQSLGWRWAFFMNLPIGAYAIARSRNLLPEARTLEHGPLPSATGIVLAIAAPALLTLAVIGSGDWGPTSLRTLAALVTGAASFVLLLVHSSRSRSPAVDLTLFRDLNFRVANWTTLVFSIAFTAMFFGLILFLTQVWGYSILRAGLAMTPGPLTVMPFAILGGRIAARRGHRGLLVTGGVVYALTGLVFLLFASATPRYLALFLPTSLGVGLAVGLVMPSLSAVAAHGLSSERYALGVAVNQAIRQLGSVLGVGVVIALVSRAAIGQLAPFRGVFAVLVAGGLATAILGAGAATSPHSSTARNGGAS